MYARVTNTIAQNEMQLTMWIETFKNIFGDPYSKTMYLEISNW